MSIEHGKYIVLEGGEGCGKDTQLEFVAEWLKEELNTEPVVVREPYDDPFFGKFIVDLLNSEDPRHDFNSLDYWQQALAFTGARRGIAKQIVNHLKNGLWVLSSRSYESTIVYQGLAAGIESSIELDQLRGVARNIGVGVEGGPVYPDMVLILDVDPLIAAQRIEGRKKDVFDSKPSEFHQKVRRGYLLEAEHSNIGDGFKIDREIIDANQSEQDVFEHILEAVNKLTQGARVD